MLNSACGLTELLSVHTSCCTHIILPCYSAIKELYSLSMRFSSLVETMRVKKIQIYMYNDVGSFTSNRNVR